MYLSVISWEVSNNGKLLEEPGDDRRNKARNEKVGNLGVFF